MGDSIQKITIAETNINIYDVVAYHIKDKTLVVFTVGETLYFNEPGDVDDVESAYSSLDSKFSGLSAGGDITDPGDGTTDPGDGTTDPTDPGDGSTDPTDPGDGTTDPTEPTDPVSTNPGGVPDDDMNPDFDPTGKNFNEEYRFYYDVQANVYYDDTGYLIEDPTGGATNPDFDPTGKTYSEEYGIWLDPVTNQTYTKNGWEFTKEDLASDPT